MKVQMSDDVEFTGKAYIKRSYMDKDGCDNVTFQFDVSQKLEVAKLNLMSRDLNSYDPALLEIKVKLSEEANEF